MECPCRCPDRWNDRPREAIGQPLVDLKSGRDCLVEAKARQVGLTGSPRLYDGELYVVRFRDRYCWPDGAAGDGRVATKIAQPVEATPTPPTPVLPHPYTPRRG